jgi:thioredoxin 1
MSSAVNVTDDTFESEVLNSDVLTVVDFWAPWCAPCHVISPALEDLANDYEGRLRVVKMNVDQNPRAPINYGVQAIPNLIFFKDGKTVDQVIGAVPKAMLQQRIEALLA